MNGSAVRTAEEAARGWRMREWPHDATVAHLIFVDHLGVPTTASIEAAIEHGRALGARAIRTSALFPRAAERLIAAGFEPIDRLTLLRLHIDDAVVDALPDVERTRPFLPWHHAAAAVVDQDAFGPMWGNDASSLRAIRSATPHHRARVVRRNGRIVGIAISGAAGSNGYVQRVAVTTGQRRSGIARSLVVDAVRWMHGRQIATALVNTGIANDAALALYEGLGFERLDDELTIAEYRPTG